MHFLRCGFRMVERSRVLVGWVYGLANVWERVTFIGLGVSLACWNGVSRIGVAVLGCDRKMVMKIGILILYCWNLLRKLLMIFEHGVINFKRFALQ